MGIDLARTFTIEAYYLSKDPTKLRFTLPLSAVHNNTNSVRNSKIHDDYHEYMD